MREPKKPTRIGAKSVNGRMRDMKSTILPKCLRRRGYPLFIPDSWIPFLTKSRNVGIYFPIPRAAMNSRLSIAEAAWSAKNSGSRSLFAISSALMRMSSRNGLGSSGCLCLSSLMITGSLLIMAFHRSWPRRYSKVSVNFTDGLFE